MKGKANLNQWRVSRSSITSVAKDEVFVFGSNRAGQHLGGAAAYAYEHFAAKWDVGEGRTGYCYAIPTMEGIPFMRMAIDRFIAHATLNLKQPVNKRRIFLVTKVGCGIAGYSVADVAPLFKKAIKLPNVFLPLEFWEYYANH